MTKLILEVPSQEDLDMLLPLLTRLKIRFSNIDAPNANIAELEEALNIVQRGCEMSAFGDALEYQIETRQERALPFRD